MSRSQYLAEALRSIGQPQGQSQGQPGGGVGFQMLSDRLGQMRQPQNPGMNAQGVTLNTPPITDQGVDPMRVQGSQARPMTGGLPGLARMFLGR